MLSLLFEPAVVLREAGVLSLSTSEAQGWLKSISFFMFPLPASPLSSLVYSYIIALYLPLRYLLCYHDPRFFLISPSLRACILPDSPKSLCLSCVFPSCFFACSPAGRCQGCFYLFLSDFLPC